MLESLSLKDMHMVLAAGKPFLPSITYYNRLESRPRTDNFSNALRAEVRDALWMLCKQWQMGEFVGDDAGTPVTGKIHVCGERLTKYRPEGGAVQTFDLSTPLEAAVERRAIPFKIGKQMLSLDLRLQMGRRWLKMVPSGARKPFMDKYRFKQPDPAAEDTAFICAHVEVWQQMKAVAGRCMDGADLYFYLKVDPSHQASDDVTGLNPADKPAVDAAGLAFVKWFEALYCQPGVEQGDAWRPERLEYQFACGVSGKEGEKLLSAEEYFHGRIDWFSFDWDKGDALPEPPNPPPFVPIEKKYSIHSFLPAPLRFNGMPDTRWWAFEDGKTNFGDIKPSTTDLPKLAFIEFGLSYANDWFMLPFTAPVGTALKIKGMTITNTFGERYWIEAAGQGVGDDWQRWSMYSLNVKRKPKEPADLTLLLLPTAPKVQEGPPLERVALVRDEMANMVWGIETTVPMAHGWPRAGNIAAAEYRACLQALHNNKPSVLNAVEKEWRAPIRYEIMTGVPENWIPFVPEHVPGSNRQVQLRRAAMPRLLENDPDPTYERVRPRTTLLREGLDANKPYHIHEEEVPRAGVHVVQTFRRTRWTGGKVFTWLGARKQTGRGEGNSGLAFDRIVGTQKEK